ncbi:DUF2271 domain-containing protein [Vibrio hannami]|uniref:DUF2271 domain-containing protein n=1 Tax=Vibrio hannami TaxID=2717094 RepID=UPI00240F1C09|nr:DUF2271 domain-containing protein [Vibrio hannami]MDG3086424.1 DUF2271 domain-containing protein [Vibrio hannami]
MKKASWIIPLLFSYSTVSAPLSPDAKLEVMFRLPAIEDTSYSRPFSAVWIENSQKQVVKTILLSASSGEWLKDLRHYWRKVGRHGGDHVDGLTSATRSSGNYRLTWDGRNEEGQKVEQGEYTLFAEVVREHGNHSIVRQKLSLTDEPSVYVIEPAQETGQINISYQFW